MPKQDTEPKKGTSGVQELDEILNYIENYGVSSSSISMPYEEYLECRKTAKQKLLAWRDKSVNEAIEEMFDEIVALASTKTFNNWTNKDASNFFFALGKYIREHKAHLNKKEDSHEHIYRNGIDNKGEYSVCECGHKIYKKGKE